MILYHPFAQRPVGWSGIADYTSSPIIVDEYTKPRIYNKVSLILFLEISIRGGRF